MRKQTRLPIEPPRRVSARDGRRLVSLFVASAETARGRTAPTNDNNIHFQLSEIAKPRDAERNYVRGPNNSAAARANFDPESMAPLGPPRSITLMELWPARQAHTHAGARLVPLGASVRRHLHVRSRDNGLRTSINWPDRFHFEPLVGLVLHPAKWIAREGTLASRRPDRINANCANETVRNGARLKQNPSPAVNHREATPGRPSPQVRPRRPRASPKDQRQT